MKNTTLLTILSAAVALFLLSSCCQKPELQVQDLQVQWTADVQQVSFTVINKGLADAGSFMVYVNPMEDPISPNHRPQRRKNVDGLAAGESLEFQNLDLSDLAHPDNAFLANVQSIQVVVDPKGMVEECQEGNNSAEKTVLPLDPSMGCLLEAEFERPDGAPPGDIVYPDPGASFTSDDLEFFTELFSTPSGPLNGQIILSETTHIIDGDGEEMWSYNLNTRLVFPEPVAYISLLASHQGGMINIGINDDLLILENYAELDGSVVDGIVVNVSSVAEGVERWEINGVINSFVVGGGQLAIDDICVK
jgi:hypothetical protein